MTGVCRLEIPRLKIKTSVPYRNEHPLGVIRTDLLVNKLKHLRGLIADERAVLNKNLRYHHEQSRGNALAGYVRDYKSQVLLIDKEEIVEVTADFLCGLHGGEDVEFFSVRKSREDTRQRLRLDLGGHGKLGVEPLLLLLLALILLGLDLDYDVAKVCRGDDRHQDDELNVLNDKLNSDGTQGREKIYPQRGEQPLVELGSVPGQQENVLHEHQDMHDIRHRISPASLVEVKLVKEVIEVRELRDDKTYHVRHEQSQEDVIHYPPELPRLRDEQDQQRQHIYHEARYEELKESYRADAVNICRFGMSLHQHAEEMHHQIDVYKRKEDLEILLNFLTDMYAGAHMNKTHAAYSDTGSNKKYIYEIT